MDELASFMGYRYSVIEGEIEKCVEAYERGESQVTLDVGGLTDSEINYIYQEVERRINR